MRQVTCTNKTDNISVTFGDTFSPFLLQDVEGIYSVDVNVNTSENSLSDGSTYIGSIIRARNIVMTIAEKNVHGNNRNLLYMLFKPRTTGEFCYEETDGDFEEKRVIDYIVESVQVNTTGQIRQATVSLICPDPFFMDPEYTDVPMTGWTRLFEFSHEFDDPESMGERLTQQSIDIYSEASAESIGMLILMEADGTVKNPRMYHVQTDSYIQLGTDDNPFTMHYGDKVLISTESNDKNAYQIVGTAMTPINEYIEEGSEYIQIVNGLNTLHYDASEGEENLLVNISYRRKYQGV